MTIVCVGVGADGWDGLSAVARHEIEDADVVFGSQRQLDLIPLAVEKVNWGSPMLPSVEPLLARYADKRRVVIASGDPLFYGVGSTLLRITADVRFVPHVSSFALACAREGWALQDTKVVSLVGRPLESLLLHLQDGAQVLVLSADATTPKEVGSLLVAEGFGESELAVWSQLGGADEACVRSDASSFDGEVDDLNVIALTCAGTGRSVVPGLADDVFDNDGQITKREVRAVVLALLAPAPGQLLWDVGAGTGSVGIEWARSGGRTVAIESSAEKAERVTRNAAALGVPSVQVVTGSAPGALGGLAAPDAVFIGGGATAEGMLDACWAALAPGGRLVVNAVTVESEAVLLAWQAIHGGELLRLSVQRTAPVGSFTGWKPMTSLTIWSGTR